MIRVRKKAARWTLVGRNSISNAISRQIRFNPTMRTLQLRQTCDIERMTLFLSYFLRGTSDQAIIWQLDGMSIDANSASSSGRGTGCEAKYLSAASRVASSSSCMVPSDLLQISSRISQGRLSVIRPLANKIRIIASTKRRVNLHTRWMERQTALWTL